MHKGFINKGTHLRTRNNIVHQGKIKQKQYLRENNQYEKTLKTITQKYDQKRELSTGRLCSKQ